MTTGNSRKLLHSVMQAEQILRGVRPPSRQFQVDATSIKALRASLELSQAKFAALRRAIRNDPKAVLSALAM